MARLWRPSIRGKRLGPMAIRTSLGRQVFIVCELCGALILREGQSQHERWHRSVSNHSDGRTLPIAMIVDPTARRRG